VGVSPARIVTIRETKNELPRDKGDLRKGGQRRSQTNFLSQSSSNHSSAQLNVWGLEKPKR